MRNHASSLLFSREEATFHFGLTWKLMNVSTPGHVKRGVTAVQIRRPWFESRRSYPVFFVFFSCQFSSLCPWKGRPREIGYCFIMHIIQSVSSAELSIYAAACSSSLSTMLQVVVSVYLMIKWPSADLCPDSANLLAWGRHLLFVGIS